MKKQQNKAGRKPDKQKAGTFIYELSRDVDKFLNWIFANEPISRIGLREKFKNNYSSCMVVLKHSINTYFLSRIYHKDCQIFKIKDELLTVDNNAIFMEGKMFDFPAYPLPPECIKGSNYIDFEMREKWEEYLLCKERFQQKYFENVWLSVKEKYPQLQNKSQHEFFDINKINVSVELGKIKCSPLSKDCDLGNETSRRDYLTYKLKKLQTERDELFIEYCLLKDCKNNVARVQISQFKKKQKNDTLTGFYETGEYDGIEKVGLGKPIPKNKRSTYIKHLLNKFFEKLGPNKKIGTGDSEFKDFNIMLDLLGASPFYVPDYSHLEPDIRRDFSGKILQEFVKKCKNENMSIAEAAASLKIDKKTLKRYLKDYKVKWD